LRWCYKSILASAAKSPPDVAQALLPAATGFIPALSKRQLQPDPDCPIAQIHSGNLAKPGIPHRKRGRCSR
jgi:hypothetical protein